MTHITTKQQQSVRIRASSAAQTAVVADFLERAIRSQFSGCFRRHVASSAATDAFGPQVEGKTERGLFPDDVDGGRAVGLEL